MAVLGAVVVGASAAVTGATVSQQLPQAAPRAVPAGFTGAKAARFLAWDKLRESAAGRPLVSPDNVQASTQVPDAQLQAGILGLHDGAPYVKGQFVGTNLWNGPVNGRWLTIQAGGVPASPTSANTTAAVFAYTRPLDPNSSAPPTVIGVISPANAPSGTFTVEQASDSGGVLTLQLSGTSTVFTFNLSGLSFEP